MPKHKLPTSSFLFFFILSGLVVVLFQTHVGESFRGILELALQPLQKIAYSVAYAASGEDSSENNTDSVVTVVQTAEQKREIDALRDQFATTTPNPQQLLPAQIIGLKAFVPGFSSPSQIVIDKGTADGVEKGFVIVRKDILLGRVVSSSRHVSLIDLTTKKDFSVTARATKTNALGVSKGQGGSILLDNVVLSDKLEKNDIVVTKGSVNESGTGAPPNLVIGKILSIEKKSSALFQTAEVAIPLDITRIDTVFVLLPNR